MEACMPYREYVEWLAYFNTGGASGPAASGGSSGSSWQKQMQVMRMFSEVQKLREAS
jgi:hypothetical protein